MHGALDSEAERYQIGNGRLHRFPLPNHHVDITIESLHETGSGVAYTTSPFTYLCESVS